MKKGYYAILPANVRYDKNLTPNAKLLYAEITALTSDKGFCWATNSYFAELYGVTKASITGWIKSLEENGYITIKMMYGKSGKNIERRCIYIKEASLYEEAEEEIEAEGTVEAESEIEEEYPTQNNFDTYSKNMTTLPKKSLVPYTKNFEEGTQNNLGRVPKKSLGGYPKNFEEGTQKILRENNTVNNTINNTKNNTVNNTVNSEEVEVKYKNKDRAQAKNEPKKKTKPPLKAKTYSDNPELDQAIKDFIENRKVIKAAMSERAITLFVNKLNREFDTDEKKIEAIDIAIMRGWKSVEKAWVDNLKATNRRDDFRSLEDSKRLAEKRWEAFLDA